MGKPSQTISKLSQNHLNDLKKHEFDSRRCLRRLGTRTIYLGIENNRLSMSQLENNGDFQKFHLKPSQTISNHLKTISTVSRSIGSTPGGAYDYWGPVRCAQGSKIIIWQCLSSKTMEISKFHLKPSQTISKPSQTISRPSQRSQEVLVWLLAVPTITEGPCDVPRDRRHRQESNQYFLRPLRWFWDGFEMVWDRILKNVTVF